MAKTLVQLSEDAREARRRYQKQWREAHPERVREYARRFWEKQAEREEATRDAR